MIKWEALKCYLRGVTIAFAAKKKKQNEAEILTLIKQIQKLESDHKRTISDVTLSELQVARSRLSSLLNLKQKKRFLKTKAEFYEWGNKSGPIIVKQAAKQKRLQKSRGIDMGGGQISKKSKDILAAFEKFYLDLYNINPNKMEADMERKRAAITTFLHTSKMARISPEMSSIIDTPLSCEEWASAIKNSKPNTAPGPDGYTLGFYKIFSDILQMPFLEAYNSIKDGRCFPLDTLRAIINVIPKEGKDHTQCKNYRPISLLNVDLKMFTKILALRLQQVITKIIHIDQSGFVPGRNIRDNTLKALNILHYVQKHSEELMMLSIDAEKAFDRVDWIYMTEVLKHIGLGTRFMQWINALYCNPTAVVRVDGKTSTSFSLSNGTRQGCPLSAVMFILTLEPFLAHIRNNVDISGLVIGNIQFKLSAYADDLLLYITKPQISIPNRMKIFEKYQEISNFRVNWDKSVAFNVTLSPVIKNTLAKTFRFAWAESHFKYLGIKIARSFMQMFEINYAALFKQIRADLDRWSTGLFSWYGRIALLKMNVLPRLLYLLQCLPILISSNQLLKLRNEFISFTWGKRKAHRLNRNLITRPKNKGGLSIPDPVKYYKAAQYLRVIDWCKNSNINGKDWITLEQISSEIPLDVLPWVSPALYRGKIDHPLINATLKTIQERPYLINLARTSPMHPVLGTPDFPIGLSDKIFQKLKFNGKFRILHLQDLCDPSRSFEMGRQLDPEISWWQIMQLRSRMNRLMQSGTYELDISDFERLCIEENPTKHGISRIYAILNNNTERQDTLQLSYIVRWQKDLNCTFSDEQITRIFYFTHNFPTACSYQENCYKILTRWYLDPVKLHRMFKAPSPLCWRCGLEHGTLFHIFWQCPKIQSYWIKVRKIVAEITNFDLGTDPAVYLFHLASIPVKAYRKSIIPHLLNAAKICIPACWKQPLPPTISSWFKKINEMMELEEIMAYTQQRFPIFSQIWQPWIEFTKKSNYIRYI